MRKFALLLLIVSALAVSPAKAEEEVADAAADRPAQDAVEKFSYYLGYRNGQALAENAEKCPADEAAFLRGVRVALDMEESQDEDKEDADYKKGLESGKRIALFAKQRFPYLKVEKTVDGLVAGLAKEDSAYTDEEISQALRTCSKFIKAPAPQDYPMLGQQAPKWDVGPWHQLPTGKTSLDISDFKGKVLYLYCFQSWCPGCHSRGFPALQEVAKKYADDDDVRFVVFQTVFEDRADKPVNTFENLIKIASKFELTMPFAQSGSREDKSKLMQAYKTRGTPWTMIIDRQGVIRYGFFHIAAKDAVELIEELKAESENTISR